MRVRSSLTPLLLSLTLTCCLAAAGCIDTDIPLNTSPENNLNNSNNFTSNNSTNNTTQNNNNPDTNNTNNTNNTTVPPEGACDLDADCPQGDFCELLRCGATPGEGRCTARPADCPADGDPACGCDGLTYANACARQLAGISPGPPERCAEPPTGCDACADNELCACEGACGSEGACVPAPSCEGLPDDPVCGCDGLTYTNDCQRQAAGACLAFYGPCGVISCGGTPGEGCAAGARCDAAAGVCADGAGPGACTPIFPTCPDLDAPVCGCDGQTYPNDCERVRAGVDLLDDGPCVTEPAACGGPERIPCADNAYCDPTPGTCGELDADGTCASPFEVCSRRYDPVCGCDGLTYTNDCLRARAAVAKQHDGECPPAATGCTTTQECSSRSERCELPPGTCGSERTGVCTFRPLECLDIMDPVCGCDNQTYPNDCQRQLADVSLLRTGSCN